jgi:hypothetical protein
MKREILMAALGLASTGAWSAEDVTRDKIDTLLQELAAKPAPTNLAPAAMCYKMAAPPNRAEYVCPTCGAKTLYEGANAKSVETARAYRADTEALRELGVDATLDETHLCDTCRTTDTPFFLYLEVKLDGKVARNSVQEHDFRKLRAFLSGKSVWTAGFGEEKPLKPELPRIRQLLGVAEPAPKAP